jgi:hypothetical protein
MEPYWKQMPLGCVLATCELVDCLPTVEVFEDYPDLDTPPEREFGDYSAGRYAWVLKNVRPLPEPVPAKGALGLWEWSLPA